ncbi:gastrula zinc finger protein XlCGF26.1-like [Ochlerotatus camptorhynchus]|uniref:gastrula zinc finger protein XlCGF26.1-like n=1 Tax=Ochlerotatus camptorhynchus TaxID=644619 RepID=UPI0031E0194E
MENSCCRICFDKDTTLLSLQTVVEFAGAKLTCMQMYQNITKLEEPAEELLLISQNICISCFGELNSCYKFKQRAIESFQVLTKNVSDKLEQNKIDEDESVTVVEFEDLDGKDIPNVSPKQRLDQPTELDEEEYFEIDFLEEKSQHDRPGTAISTIEGFEIEHDTCEDANVVDAEYRCTTCSELLNSQAALDVHSIIEHCQRTSSGELLCPVCNKLFGTRKTLRQHSRIHQKRDSRKFKCSFCEKAFNYGHHLRIHETTHTKEKPFPCSTCGKTFASKDRLTNHQLQHADDFKHNCELCTGSFRFRKALKMHCILKHDAAVDKFDPIKCDKCGKELYSQSAASAHLKGPCGNDVCTSMDSEKVAERDRKDHTCDQCSRAFRSRAAHIMHLKLHNTKECKCQDCPQIFPNLYDLQCHRSQEHQNRTHTCEICGRSFLQMVVLKRHLKTHSGERSFMCAFCPKRFTQMATLKNHESTHSEVCRFACSQCSKKYKFLGSLNNHVKMYHGDEEM